MGAMIEKRTYEVTVLSPVHIGSGQKLSAYDLAVIEGRLWRFDVDKVSERLIADRKLLNRYLNEGAQVLAAWPEDVRRSCARYHLPWKGALPKDAREHISDPLGRFYLPGTSIKGAIRTAIVWAYHYGIPKEAKKRQIDLIGVLPQKGRPRARKNEAGVQIEHIILGSTPNRDILRALHVTDSGSLSPSDVRMFPVRVAVQEPNLRLTWFVRPGVHVSQPADATLIWVEAIPRGAKTRVTITLDRFLLEGQTLADNPVAYDPAKQLGFDRKKRFLANWEQRCNVMAQSIAREELAWAKTYHFDAFVKFYTWLLGDMKKHPQSVYLTVGWGVGWRGKTAVEPLGESAVQKARDMYQLGRGDIFPKTRRVIFQRGRPYAPLGWIRLDP